MQKRLHAEVVQRAPEEDRCLPRLPVCLGIETGAGARDDLDRLDQLPLARGSDQFFDDRVGRSGDGNGFHPPSSLLPLVEEHRVGLEVVDTTEVRSVAERPVHRRCRDPEHALDLVEQLERIPGRLIQLVDERQDRQAVPATHLEELERLGLHALGRIQHHHHAVHREQRAVRVLAEVLVAGRVEQRDMVPLELELERRRADGDPALLLHLHPVRHRVALRPASAHGPGEVDRTGIQQQLLRQGRLAGIGMGNDRERPAAGDFAFEQTADDADVFGG